MCVMCIVYMERKAVCGRPYVWYTHMCVVCFLCHVGESMVWFWHKCGSVWNMNVYSMCSRGVWCV
jgi:hypothetical protein